MVAFAFYESPVTNVFFNLRPGYEELAEELVTYELPEGFHFVDPLNSDPVKISACMWKGFDHEDKGPFEHWDAKIEGEAWTPQRAYNGVVSPTIAPPPHATHKYNVIIADEKEEYVCFSGMWWVEKNKLAYMEPLCTVPE